MGYSRWSDSDWSSYVSSKASKSTDEIFTTKSLKPEFDPKNIDLRESRDSAKNPQSNAIIIACDVTGSMGMLADTLVRKGIGTTFEEILKRLPVTDPHLMVMGIGDVVYDRAPL